MVTRVYVDRADDFEPERKFPWMDDAACLGKDYRQWFPETKQETADAKEFCNNHCTVRLKCLAFAMQKEKPKNKDHKTLRNGIFGGLTEKERGSLQELMDEQAKEKKHAQAG